ncbi:hypothetical protein N9L02_03395, partial [Gammaproteobacteria bacterium]|nr:hypothetical protein [Gammaproteobacteria bacterium]
MLDTLSSIQGNNWKIDFIYSSENLVTISALGSWLTKDNLPDPKIIMEKLCSAITIKNISYDIDNVTAWDSGFLSFIIKLNKLCQMKSLDVSTDRLTNNMLSLLKLANAVPERIIENNVHKNS